MFYGISVQPRDGSRNWQIWRRYAEFRGLCENLGSYATSMTHAPFPKKTMNKHLVAEPKVGFRRAALEGWLVAVVQGSGPVHMQRIHQFLETSKHYRPATAPGAAEPKPKAKAKAKAAAAAAAPVVAAAAPPQAAAKAAAAAEQRAVDQAAMGVQVAAPAASAPALEAKQEVVTVALPEGSVAGTEVAVTTPDGRQVVVVVPESHNGTVAVTVPAS
mmetsp:Transcript_44525/g.100689  ORF Transcript_44525/g.100689 Transcript_44525/m.100689 type:complete len:216 (+) Transcript_44525:466-1113(+)